MFFLESVKFVNFLGRPQRGTAGYEIQNSLFIFSDRNRVGLSRYRIHVILVLFLQDIIEVFLHAINHTGASREREHVYIFDVRVIFF